MDKEVKKLHRMLLAAGIEFEYKTKNKITVIHWTTPDSDGRIFHDQEWSDKTVIKEGAGMVLKSIKHYIEFEGKDWDGLNTRLDGSNYVQSGTKDSTYWYLQLSAGYNAVEDKPFIWGFEADETYNWYVLDYTLSGKLKAKPHQVWEFLDKIDAAKAKGGKQTVKFKGNEYEFDFPTIAVFQKGGEKVIDKDGVKKRKSLSPNGNVIDSDCCNGDHVKKPIDFPPIISEIEWNLSDADRQKVSSILYKMWDMFHKAPVKFGKVGDVTEIEGFQKGGIQTPNGNVIIEECNEHTEEQLKQLIPATIEGKRKRRLEIEKTLRVMTKEERSSEKGKALINQRRLLVKAYNKQCEEIRKEEPNEPAWKSVTGWDSIKDNCTNGLLYYNSSDEKQPKVFEAKYRYPNYFATEKQAKQILAFSQLTQIHKAMMDGQTFNDTWKEKDNKNVAIIFNIYLNECKYVASAYVRDIDNYQVNCTPFEIEFYTEEQRNHFIKHNEDLINQYLGLC